MSAARIAASLRPPLHDVSQFPARMRETAPLRRTACAVPDHSAGVRRPKTNSREPVASAATPTRAARRPCSRRRRLPPCSPRDAGRSGLGSRQGRSVHCAPFIRIRARRGHQVAAVAVERKLAVLCWDLLTSRATISGYVQPWWPIRSAALNRRRDNRLGKETSAGQPMPTMTRPPELER